MFFLLFLLLILFLYVYVYLFVFLFFSESSDRENPTFLKGTYERRKTFASAYWCCLHGLIVDLVLRSSLVLVCRECLVVFSRAMERPRHLYRLFERSTTHASHSRSGWL